MVGVRSKLAHARMCEWAFARAEAGILKVNLFDDGAQQASVRLQLLWTLRTRYGFDGFVRERPQSAAAGLAPLLDDGLEGCKIKKQLMMELDVHLVARKAEILKLAAHKENPGFGRPGLAGLRLLVAGGKARDDAVRRDDVKDVKTLDGGGHIGRVNDLVVLALDAPRDVGRAGLDGNHLINTEVLDARTSNAAGGRQGDARLNFNHPLNGTRELSAQRMGRRVIVEPAVRFHWGHLDCQGLTCKA